MNMQEEILYKIAIHVPESHVEAVKQAAFDAGAGRQGNYEHCAFQWRGEGQFRPLAGSQPYSGEQDKLSRVTEYRVEMICQAAHIQAAVQRSEEHTSELQSRGHLVCRLLLEKKK